MRTNVWIYQAVVCVVTILNTGFCRTHQSLQKYEKSESHMLVCTDCPQPSLVRNSRSQEHCARKCKKVKKNFNCRAFNFQRHNRKCHLLPFDRFTRGAQKQADVNFTLYEKKASSWSPPQKLNEQAAAMFESAEEPEVSTGLGVMNELVVPCIPLLLIHDTERDLLAVEDMRNRWCSYLGQEMEPNLQEKLTDFLPKLLDCSTEIKSFHDPPKLPTYSTLELSERFSRVMAAVGRAPTDGR